ncbi:hypothetical protein ACLB2K_072166 [Fragaria x ananassa]
MQQVEVGTENHLIVLKDFSRLLDCQIEKFVLFLLEQQGILASRLSNLGKQNDSLLQQFDKRFGFKFTNYYVKTRANHPYSQLRQVCKHVGIGAVVGAISRNLVDLHDHRGSYISIYDQPALSHPDPIVDSIREAVESAWSNRSYMRPLVFSSIVLFVGNTLYALAYDLDSLSVLLIGRLFCGLGSARAVNRRYISDCVPLKLRIQASAGFISASALGMACGPALACLFQTEFKIYKLTFNVATLPGWVMALAWLVYLLWLCISFREPSRETKENVVPEESNSGRYINGSRETKENVLPEESYSGRFINISVDNYSTQPLLMNSNNKLQDEDEDEDCDDAEEDSKEFQKPVNSIVSAYRLLTPSVKVQLLIYILCSNMPWRSYLLMLPVNVLVGSYISNIFEERYTTKLPHLQLLLRASMSAQPF